MENESKNRLQTQSTNDTIAQFCKKGTKTNRSSPLLCLPGPIAQLARALAWHARGQGFESPWVHTR
jgi:hypothetical protein